MVARRSEFQSGGSLVELDQRRADRGVQLLEAEEALLTQPDSVAHQQDRDHRSVVCGEFLCR